MSSYFDFADNDFQFFMASYNHGMIANMMGAMAQGICEKYMKHLISSYDDIQTREKNSEHQSILRSHNLTRLMKYLKENLGIEYSKETSRKMKTIDGFYFSTRYPGEDSIMLDSEDIEDCKEAVEACRKETLELINSLRIQEFMSKKIALLF